jgi:hypothetical protein
MVGGNIISATYVLTDVSTFYGDGSADAWDTTQSREKVMFSGSQWQEAGAPPGNMNGAPTRSNGTFQTSGTSLTLTPTCGGGHPGTTSYSADNTHVWLDVNGNTPPTILVYTIQ